MAYRFSRFEDYEGDTEWHVYNGDGAFVATLRRERGVSPTWCEPTGDMLWFAEGCGEIDITVDIPANATFNAAKIATVGALCDAREEAKARDLRNVLARRKRLRSLANELSELADAVPHSESLRSIDGPHAGIGTDAVDDPAFANETALTMASLACALGRIVDRAMAGEASVDGYR